MKIMFTSYGNVDFNALAKEIELYHKESQEVHEKDSCINEMGEALSELIGEYITKVLDATPEQREREVKETEKAMKKSYYYNVVNYLVENNIDFSIQEIKPRETKTVCMAVDLNK